MDDYSKLIPFMRSGGKDFKVFDKYLENNIDYSKESFDIIYQKNITSWVQLGDVKHIGGHLELYDTPIKSLGNLESVGGGLSLEESPITSLGNLKSVGGYLNLNSTSITSLGNLKSVGRWLDLRNINITSLGNLESVGGKIGYDKGTPVEDLLKERGLI